MYWVGDKPSRPISITIRDSGGRPLNLSVYSDVKVRMLGSDNEELDLTGSSVTTSGGADGRLTFRFPTYRSLFTKPGEYLLQVELGGTGTLDRTTTHTIMVRRLGGVK
jgi:hypothetical protein